MVIEIVLFRFNWCYVAACTRQLPSLSRNLAAHLSVIFDLNVVTISIIPFHAKPQGDKYLAKAVQDFTAE